MYCNQKADQTEDDQHHGNWSNIESQSPPCYCFLDQDHEQPSGIATISTAIPKAHVFWDWPSVPFWDAHFRKSYKHPLATQNISIGEWCKVTHNWLGKPLTLKATDTLWDPPLARCLRQAAASDHVGYTSWAQWSVLISLACWWWWRMCLNIFDPSSTFTKL